MSDYDYGNARLRAMKSRLLPVAQLNSLTETRNIDLLLTDLSTTAYQKSVDVALIRAVGFERITVLLQHHLVTTVAKMRQFYQGIAGELISLLLLRYDIHNLKVILRGLSQHIPSTDIQRPLLPIGELNQHILAQLSAAERVSVALDMLASMRFMIAAPLIKLRSQQADASIAALEVALEQWYFAYASTKVNQLKQQNSLFAQALEFDADFINLLTVFRFVHLPDEPTHVFKQLNIEQLSTILVPAGKLSHQLLEQVAHCPNMPEALELLEKTSYSATLNRAFNHYQQSKLLSEFERALRKYRTQHSARYIARDPLGIGVPLGYLALKENEIRNLRAIAWGITLGHSADTIKEDLEVVA